MDKPIRVVRAFYAALAAGDVPGVLSLLDPAVEWTEAKRFPYYSGTWKGRQAVLDNLLRCLAEDWLPFSATPLDFVCEGQRVVTFGVYGGTYKRTGKAMEAAFAHLWTVRGDKIVAFQMYTDTVLVLEAMTL